MVNCYHFFIPWNVNLAFLETGMNGSKLFLWNSVKWFFCMLVKIDNRRMGKSQQEILKNEKVNYITVYKMKFIFVTENWINFSKSSYLAIVLVCYNDFLHKVDVYWHNFYIEFVHKLAGKLFIFLFILSVIKSSIHS